MWTVLEELWKELSLCKGVLCAILESLGADTWAAATMPGTLPSQPVISHMFKATESFPERQLVCLPP